MSFKKYPALASFLNIHSSRFITLPAAMIPLQMLANTSALWLWLYFANFCLVNFVFNLFAWYYLQPGDEKKII